MTDRVLSEVLEQILTYEIGRAETYAFKESGLITRLADAAMEYKTGNDQARQQRDMYEGTLLAIATDELSGEENHNPAQTAANVLEAWNVSAGGAWVAAPQIDRVVEIRKNAAAMGYDMPALDD